MNKLWLFFLAILMGACTGEPPDESPLAKPCLSCEELKDLSLPDVKITQAEQLQEPAVHCKLSGIIGAEVRFELLLPLDWNARYLMGGNGGFAGSMQYNPGYVAEGYATGGTDTGHQGSGIKADWALNNRERQINFGHLAVHHTAGVSKAIISHYYCSDPEFSYFVGCSRGGGQAMMEAQRYPNDFDGIVCGAPAFDWPAIAAEFVQNAQVIYPDPSNQDQPVISQDQLALLQAKILEQCDDQDGVADSIINDPRECDFDWDQLPRCADDTMNSGCFTSAQVMALRTIYQGPKVQNILLYPGFPFGCENEPGGWHPWITGPFEDIKDSGFPTLQFGFGTEIFKYLIFQDPEWDYSSYDYANFFESTREAAAYLNATSTDYGQFKQNGSKMIMWHGWGDPALSALATIEHYDAAKEADTNLDQHIRLFLLPGVVHCGGGPGPSEVNWLEVVRDWVEKGNAPERVVLSKSREEEVFMTRPVFPYPRKAVYDGTGDPNEEGSFN